MTAESGTPPTADEQLLRRIERRALVLTAVAVVAAAFVPGGGWNAMAGVAGGALLVGVSYWAIKRGVGGLADRVLRRSESDPPGPRRRGPHGLVTFVLRYALLAFLAYVMIARLRLPPLALLSGASVMVGAAALELARVFVRGGRP